MRRQKLGPLNVHIAGGEDREGGGDGPLVVLLHGFGAPGTDLVGLWRALRIPRDCRILFPEAPIALPPHFGAGRAWWMPDMERLMRSSQSGQPADLAGEVPEGLDEAAEGLIQTLEEAKERLAPRSGRLVLGGFSQGAMLSLVAALDARVRVDGLVLMSGALVDEARHLPQVAKAKIPVFQSHGEGDPILSFDAAKRLHEQLKARNWPAEWLPFRGGHEIPMSVIEGVGDFATRVLVGP